MNKFAKSLFLTMGFNALIILCGFAADAGFFILLMVTVALQISIGAIMMIPRQRRETGGGLFVAGCISLLIGLSICSTMSFNFH